MSLFGQIKANPVESLELCQAPLSLRKIMLTFSLILLILDNLLLSFAGRIGPTPFVLVAGQHRKTLQPSKNLQI
jgi:hypothetical protein